ncbi:MAG: CDP-glycerol glycerophosphotransferase family protein, partial [Candidatus Omnitrophota bacterium]|nr:CDP-glycerol glycerophosphotransferase family protein [Candidatus Omnitrophota bacterium]
TQSYVIVPTWGYKFDDLMPEIKKRFPQSKIILLMEESGHLKRKIRLAWLSLAKIFPFLRGSQSFDFVIPVDLLSSAWDKKEDPIFKQSVDGLNVLLERGAARVFNSCDVDISSLIIDKIQHGLLKEMEKLQRRVSFLKDILQRVHPKVVISPYSTGFYYALGELSTLLGAESCVITHGTHVPPNNKYEEIEDYWLAKGVVLNDYRTVAIQSPWAKKFLNHFNDNRDFLYTGPLIFSQKQNGNRLDGVDQGIKNSKKKNILYAATQRDHFRMRFYITETLDEFLESLKDIVLTISQYPDLHLLLRPHPACELSESDFKCLLPKSDQISVVTGGKFEDVLSMTDLLISYSSTCIEEALANNIPVVLYDRWYRYNHFNIKPYDPLSDLSPVPAVYIHQQAKLNEYLSRFSKGWKVPLEAFDEYRYPRGWNERFYDYVGQCLEDKKG